MKYMGSKARIAKSILPIILAGRKADQWYVEPFAGGMNSICEVNGNRLANDNHFYLIQMWKELVSGWEPPAVVTRNEYSHIKANKGSYPPYLVGWVGFNCSYSGKWFGGFAGRTRTKTGAIRDYQSEAIRNVMAQSKKLSNCAFSCTSYNQLLIPPESIIYCDPPYKGSTQYFQSFDHSLFWQWVRNVSQQGHRIFVSEYAAPSDFRCIWQKQLASSLSANGKSGGSVISTEKLFILDG